MLVSAKDQATLTKIYFNKEDSLTEIFHTGNNDRFHSFAFGNRMENREISRRHSGKVKWRYSGELKWQNSVVS